MKSRSPYLTFILLVMALPVAATDTAESVLQGYQAKGAGPFNAERGSTLWQKRVPQADGSTERSCPTCHGTDLRKAGEHARTGKPIKAMSTAVNPERLTDQKKIEKWFKRNCKWTWGRVCTPQEKGDLMRFIQSQ